MQDGYFTSSDYGYLNVYCAGLRNEEDEYCRLLGEKLLRTLKKRDKGTGPPASQQVPVVLKKNTSPKLLKKNTSPRLLLTQNRGRINTNENMLDDIIDEH